MELLQYISCISSFYKTKNNVGNYRKDAIAELLVTVAQQMVVAARTAPKGKGVSNMEMMIIEGEDVKILARRLATMGQELGVASFVRDAGNLEHSPVVFAIGTRISPLGLKKCGLCGFENCTEKTKYPLVPCSFNTGDLGIAIGSAASVAMDNRVDNRIMYTAGQALIDLKWLGDDIRIAYVIPLSATSKNIFFDRS